MNLKSLGDVKIEEMYGGIKNEIIPTGRYNGALADVDKYKALTFKTEVVDKYNIKFAYLLNAPYNMEKCDYHKLEEYLDWIINIFKADSLTVSSYGLMEFVRKLYPEVNINVSTIAGVQDIESFNRYTGVKPARIILHHNMVRNIKTLKFLIEHSKKTGIELELMVNESCLNLCPNREEHYNCLGDNRDDHKFHLACNSKKIQQPYNFLFANFIRPEDLSFYHRLGINMFKITGRSKPAWWLEEVVAAYLNQSYPGNLIRLLGIDPALKAEEWIYISNSSLEGFLENLPWDLESQMKYCKEYILKLYKNKDFYVNNEFVEFYIENDCLFAKINRNIYD